MPSSAERAADCNRSFDQVRGQRRRWNIHGRRRSGTLTSDAPLVTPRNAIKPDWIYRHLVPFDAHAQEVAVAVQPHRAEGIVVVEVPPARRDVEINSKQCSGDETANDDHFGGKEEERQARPVQQMQIFGVCPIKEGREHDHGNGVHDGVRGR